MKILIAGHGGREHTLLWKLRRDDPNATFFITRGNGGTGRLATAISIAPTDVAGLASWAEANAIDLTVVGPEGALDAGIADEFSARGLALFGPTRDAARIETSKAYAKDLMSRAGVPTADFATFDDAASAQRHIRERGAPIVVKASGLAAGKGAIVCADVETALTAARDMLEGGRFGAAGARVVVEEFMEGEEASVFALTDGRAFIDMLPAQDHKRIGEGDTGPNTGGMGAYAPATIVDAATRDRIRAEILQPTLDALAHDGAPFRGLLYAGLMLTGEGPKVVEFNARFGDPETQALLPLLGSALLEPMLEVARGGSVAGHAFSYREGAALTTVLASAGYPASSHKGDPISIPEDIAHADDLLLFHAGTRLQDGVLVTDGGRVLAVTALAPSIEEAATRSRQAAAAIHFDGKQFRRDIGWRELQRAGVSTAG